jgi:hypothetical protein
MHKVVLFSFSAFSGFDEHIYAIGDHIFKSFCYFGYGVLIPSLRRNQFCEDFSGARFL